ncbi:uncharacterized protein BO66DRAFT_455555 [Aspergillus aculeatinus CBS 121060]|uniref:Uncharacterized protein n=1 Tax=Aspergillus aculeatinus CBS 121060 TaxID=1448322 RepID=A0ACD1H4B4_9EURO|nr:hypothetical protein BO66DRAFT_455555 [Aspergillus aculeatinus CBS 121060]RAH68389.1 hypothetical protein BO66DRAFT_455555 [Aspergillus aculeatinus CBS 121060]
MDSQNDFERLPNSEVNNKYDRSKAVDPIAIVGMAMRLPGGVTTADEFWDMLVNKKTGHCEIPGNRFSVDAFYSETRPHSVRAKHGYFLHDDPAEFDAPFFSISQYEAGRMDPQQRKLLEVVWECLESAGETHWRGRDVGCYIGVFGGDWLGLTDKDHLATDRYYVLGTGNFTLSNRISYEYDFRGPSMTLETGCSASMMALHEACNALNSEQCSSAIVAGTNLILSPTMMTSMSDNMIISPSGICRTFDNAADGYGRGEAVSAIYIKALSSAVENNDPIRAVIRATATNSDGKTPNFTTPGVHSQESLIEATYRAAGISDLSETGYFECHGTGTQVGDAAEVSVIAKLFGGRGITIGSVKPNVGHSEGASGITSIIKSALCLEQRIIPPTIYQTPNTEIPFEERKIYLPSQPMTWPQDRKERISVNCFGIGGSNVHAILESYRLLPKANLDHAMQSDDTPELLLVSASTKDSLKTRISAVTEFANRPSAAFSDLAYTLRARRTHMANRAFAVVRQNSQIDESSFESHEMEEDHLVTLAFSGQGPQWPGMGKALMHKFVEFRTAISEMDGILQSLPDSPDWSLADEISKDVDSRIHEAHITQPLCTAFQIALFHVMLALGLKFDYLVGHSSGEVGAAYAAGAITMRCAILLAYYRGIATKSEQGQGSMYAVSLGSEEVGPYLRGDVVIACINSPKSVTLSGYKEPLEETIHDIQQQRPEAICKLLKVDVAYHSHQMTHCGRVYESLIAPHMEHHTGHMLPFVSSVTCSMVESPTELGASYWRRNLESPVKFQGAVVVILKCDIKSHVFVELGPHSVLSAPLKQIWRAQSSGQKQVYVPTIIRGNNDPEAQLLRTLGLLHSNGVSVKLSIESHDKKYQVLTGMPIYPWMRGKSLWTESRVVREWRLNVHPYHELLGSRVTETPELEPTWRNLLSLYAVPWICDHVLQGSVVFPAAGYIAMAGEAIRQLFPSTEGFVMKNLMLKAPWILEENKSFEVITGLKPIRYNDMEDSEWYSVSIIVHDGNSWTKHCQGQVRPESRRRQIDGTSETYLRAINPETWYEALNRKGLAYGPRFRGLKNISANTTAPTATASIVDDASEHDSKYFVHPIAIDQCLQLLSVAQSNGLMRCLTGLAIPASIEEIYITYGGKEMNVQAAASSDAPEKRLGNATLSTDRCVSLSLRNVFFFSLDDEVSYGDPVVPLVAQMVWTKDIDFVPSDKLLIPRAPMYSNPKANRAIQALSKIAILHILNCANVVISVEPRSDHMRKWKAYIMNQARIVAEGKECFFPESRNWVSVGIDERNDLISEVLDDIQPIQEEFAVILTVLQNVYENCAQFLLGTASPLEVFLKDKMLERYYAVTRPQQMKDLLYLLGTTKPGIRIIEIGAGTGCATSEVLKSLQTEDGVRLYSSYTFTDITPGFFAPAVEKFKDCSGLEFKTLDINLPPGEQGFELHTFDLVIASNAVHITPSLQCSLKHVHDLLRPDGRLLLHELNPGKTIGQLLGVLPGWWLGEETDRRNRPYVPPERWDEELKQAGFTGNETAVYDNDRPLQTNFTMLSRPIECKVKRRGSVHIVYSGTQSIWMQGLSTSLVESGYSVTSGIMREEHPSGALIVSLLDFDEPFFYDLTEKTFESLQHFLRTIVGGAILWLTHPSHLSCPDPRFGPIHGFTRTIRQELDVRFTVLEIDGFDTGVYSAILRLIEKMQQAQQFSSAEIDQEYVLHEGNVYVSRCHWPSYDRSTPRAEKSETPCKKLDIAAYGLLDTLRWCDTAHLPVEQDELEIDVRYVGLNFRDLMVAMGLVGDRSSLGFEATGVVCRTGSQVLEFQPGDRVVFTQNGLFTTKTVANQRYCLKLPDELGMEDASTMFSVYATVLYSFLRVGALQANQTVLIHSACGGVGQAAIHACRAVGAKVYATVGNDEKVQYLIDHFGMSRTDIFNSRDESFVADLMRETNGRGVDIVLNSLAGKLLHASWKCVAPFGKMIELGKRDFLTNGILDMAPFHSNRAFIGVDMIGLAEEDSGTWEWLTEQFKVWYVEGKIKPIHPIKVFEAAEVSSAFRYLQTGTHIGKILVRMPDSAQELPSTPSVLSYRFSTSSSYLLVGGLGGLGRSVSSWMAERGASEIVYLSRSAGQSESDQLFREELKSQGCEAIFVVGSATVLEDVQEAIARCTKPLAGVMLLSMVLRDQSYLNMSYDDWTTCLDPKVQGAWNLHHAVQSHNLDFFILFSSVSAISGFPGQANYAAANSFLAAFTQHRRQLGLKSSILDLGPVEDVGTISRNPKLRYTLRRHAARLLNEREFLQGVELAILQPPIPGYSMHDDYQGPRITNPAIVGLGNTRPLDDPTSRPSWRRGDCRFALYSNMDLKGSRHEMENNELKMLLDSIERDPALVNDARIRGLIVIEVGKMIMPHLAKEGELTEEQCEEIQIDSLVAIEIRAWAKRVMSLDLTLVEIAKAATIGGLATLCLGHLRSRHEPEEKEKI